MANTLEVRTSFGPHSRWGSSANSNLVEYDEQHNWKELGSVIDALFKGDEVMATMLVNLVRKGTVAVSGQGFLELSRKSDSGC